MGFILSASEEYARVHRRKWTTKLKRDIAAIERRLREHEKAFEASKGEMDEAPMPAKYAAEAQALVDKAGKLPPLPPLTQNDMLGALEKAAISFGIEPTIALRADLRKVIDNKPPPDVAHTACLEVLAKHKEMQQMRVIAARMTRH
jgi:hypothetical protein